MPLSSSSRISEPLYLDLPETPTKIDNAFTYERARMFQELYENLLKTAQPITPASPFDHQTNMFTYGPLMQSKPRNPFSIESILGFQNSSATHGAVGQQFTPEPFYGQTMMDFSSPPRRFAGHSEASHLPVNNHSNVRSSFLTATPQSVCSNYSSPSSSSASSPIKSQDETSHRMTSNKNFTKKSNIKKVASEQQSLKTKGKRIRTIFTADQLERLESEFERQQYMVGSGRNYLAATLNLTEAQVKVWFQNRRIKWRKQHLEGGVGEEEALKL